MALEIISISELSKDELIRIPDGAKTYSLKRRRIIFYSDGLGKYRIPEGVREVYFPDLEVHMHNIHYGKPCFAEKEKL